MAAIVVKLTGHAMDGPPSDVAEYLSEFSGAMARLKKVFDVAVTIGGGQRARELIKLATHFGSRNVIASSIGSDIGLANCRVLSAALRGAGVPVRQPTDSWSRAADEMDAGIVPVLYGYWPGMTSDAVAVYFADHVGAQLVMKLSTTDMIYTHDPSHEDARPLHVMSHAELETMAIREDRRVAGASFVLDLLAARRLKESGIALMFGHMSCVNTIVGSVLGGDTNPVPCTVVGKWHPDRSQDTPEVGKDVS